MNKLIPCILFCFAAQTALAQKNEISLLNGRFSFVFPDSAINLARSTDIMSADPDGNKETRVVYDIGDQRMVFFAEELDVLSRENPEPKLRELMKGDSAPAIRTVFNKDSVVVVSLIPAKFDKNKKAILIETLIVKNPDNQLSRVNVYLNPKAFEHRANFDAIVQQVLGSFKKGARRINIHARTESFPVFGTKSVMQLALPENYTVSKNGKYDFEVYTIQKATEFGDDTNGTLVIYFGFHPSLFSDEYKLTDSRTADSEGEFMRQKFKWMNFNDDTRHLIVREQTFTDDDIQKDTQEHIAIIANDQNTIEELTLIVKNILLKYDK